MADILATMANETGVSPELARKGMGAILGFFKDKLPSDSFAKIRAAVPDADDAMAAARDAAPASGGILSAVSSIGAKIFGGGATDVIAKFGQLGFSAEQLQAFLPKAIEFLKNKVPADTLKQISALLPTPDPVIKPK